MWNKICFSYETVFKKINFEILLDPIYTTDNEYDLASTLFHYWLFPTVLVFVNIDNGTVLCVFYWFYYLLTVSLS